MTLPEPAHVDVEMATFALHAAESAVARQDWRRAWPLAMDHAVRGTPIARPRGRRAVGRVVRRRLGDMHATALECYATACLPAGWTGTAGSGAGTRELLDVAPLQETGHLLLMQVLAARGNVAEVAGRLRTPPVLLREELGVNPSQAVQDAHTKLLT